MKRALKVFSEEISIFLSFWKKHLLMNLLGLLVLSWSVVYLLCLKDIEEPDGLLFFSEFGEISYVIALAFVSSWIFFYLVTFRADEIKWRRSKNIVGHYAISCVERVAYLIHVANTNFYKKGTFPGDHQMVRKLFSGIKNDSQINTLALRIDNVAFYSGSQKSITFYGFIRLWKETLSKDLDTLNTFYHESNEIKHFTSILNHEIQLLHQTLEKQHAANYIVLRLMITITKSSEFYHYLKKEFHPKEFPLYSLEEKLKTWFPESE